MKDSKYTEKQFMRTLDDTQCSNIIIAKNIRRLVGKFPNMKKIAIDCWVHDGHYTEFELQGSNLVWRHDKNRKCTNGLPTVNHTNENLSTDEINKLIRFTYQTMCDSMNSIDLTDTPEDLLSYAEQKLQELINSEKESE